MALQQHTSMQVLDEVAPAADSEAMQEAEPEVADLAGPENKQKLLYCERFVEFLTDLLSQLPTRRFIRTLLEDRAILTKCRMSGLFQHPQGDRICPRLLAVSATFVVYLSHRLDTTLHLSSFVEARMFLGLCALAGRLLNALVVVLQRACLFSLWTCSSST